MKQGSNTRGRPRGRVGGGGGGNKRTPNRNQTFDSNGPSVRLRGNAMQLVEKYTALARDTGSQGDRVLSENYLQHADHYYRVYMALTGQTDANRPGAPQPVRTNEDGDDVDTAGEPSNDSERPRYADRDDGREPRDRSRGGNGSTRPGSRPSADRDRDRDRDQDDVTEGALALLPSGRPQGGEAPRDGAGDDDETAASDRQDTASASASDGTVVDGVRATLGLDRPADESTSSQSDGEQAPRRRRPARRAPRADAAGESTPKGSDGETEAEAGDGEAAPRPRGRGRRGPRRASGSAGKGAEASGGGEGESDTRLL
jgi:hypothetical protein